MTRPCPIALALLLLASLTACTSWDTTTTARTAREQRLISAAADRAAHRLVRLPGVTPKELGASYLDASLLEGTDKAYAVHAIRRELLDRGVRLVESKAAADTILEVAAGALGIDHSSLLIGLPALNIPIPLSGQVGIPEIALLKRDSYKGVAKLSLSARRAKTGEPISRTQVNIGTAYDDQWELLFFIGFSVSDLPEEPVEDELDEGEDPESDETRGYSVTQ